MPVRMTRNIASFAALALALPVLACAPQEDAPEEPAAVAQEDGVQKASDGADAAAPSLGEFSDTAWRVMAEDGARYVTYIDADGTYRDFRNGEPWQQGSWKFDPAEESGDGVDLLCFMPDAEDGSERCWEPGRLLDDELIVTSGGGRRVALEKVTYAAPEGAETEE